MKLLDRLFGRAEEINGNDRCPTYMYRWVILKSHWGKVYIHKFVGDDWSLDLHDHPKRFVSIGLAGSYLERTEEGTKRFDAPWFRTFPAEHKHRITTPFGVCWTLVIVGRVVREWGFWHKGQWHHWKDYVYGSAKFIADKMTACN